MAVKLSPFGPNPQWVDGNGDPANGYKLFFYAAGSSTKQNTYTDSTGNTANSNPIVLNSLGQPANAIWFTEGLDYKAVLAPANDTDPPASAIWTRDNLEGINDAGNTADQWKASGVTPTYVSATQFTVPGDQTEEFKANRRFKATVTAGTVYGYYSSSSYDGSSLTTVNTSNDSGSLDAGLSAISHGLITPDNTSLRVITGMIADAAITYAKLAASTITSLIAAVYADPVRAVPVRQTVLSGPVTSAGLPDFGGSTGAATVTMSGTLVATAANGTTNRTGEGTDLEWTGLTTNGTMYLYVDVGADGTLTPGAGTVAPLYRWGGADVTTSGQFTFNIQQMQGKVGDGSAATQTYRVYVGQVTVASNVTSAITWYALMGRYTGAWTSTLPGTTTAITANHNLGIVNIASSEQVKPRGVLEIECITAEQSYAIGDVVSEPPSSYTNAVMPLKSVIQGNVVYAITGATTAFNGFNGGAAAALTAARWKYRFRVERGW